MGGTAAPDRGRVARSMFQARDTESVTSDQRSLAERAAPRRVNSWEEDRLRVWLTAHVCRSAPVLPYECVCSM